MKAKEFLQQIKRIETELSMLEHEINDMYTPISAVRFDNVPGVPDYDATLHIVERITELQNVYSSRMAELIERRRECLEVIQQMTNEKAQSVIYCRYVQMMNFRAIARKLVYSRERIMQLHREGLAEVERILETLHIFTL